MECIICKKKKKYILGDTMVCMNCAGDISTKYDIAINNNINTIMEEYNIYNLDTSKLLMDCMCKHPYGQTIDFYTKEVRPEKYIIILCVICNGCGGYREVNTGTYIGYFIKHSIYERENIINIGSINTHDYYS